MKRTVRRLISVALLLSVLLCGMVFPTSAETDTVITKTLKNTADTSYFTTYGCSVQATSTGLKIVPDNSNVYPYVTFGESGWTNYTVEVDTHGVRVGGILTRVGSQAINHANGFAGYVCAYDSAWLFTGTGTPGADGKSGTWTTVKTGDPDAAALSYTENLHWKVTVNGTNITCDVSNPSTGSVIAHTSVTSGVFSSGKAGFRVKSDNTGTFSDLKVTIPASSGTGSGTGTGTATVEGSVVIEKALTNSADTSLFTAFGCTPTTSANGLSLTSSDSLAYPYVLFGEDNWKNYTVEVDTHGMHVGGILMRAGHNSIAHADGFGGYVCSYDSAYLFAGKGTVNADGKAGTWATLKNGSPASAAMTYTADQHWTVTVKDSTVTCTVTNPSNGNVISMITVSDDSFASGKAGLRIKKDDGGTFRNLKVTLAETTGTSVTPPEEPGTPIETLTHSLTTNEGLPTLHTYGATASVTADGLKITSTGNADFPYVLFGDSAWKDYTVEVDTHGVHVGGVIVRGGNDAINHADGFGGYVCSYDSAWLFSGTGTVGNDGKSATWAQIKTGTPYASPLSYAENLHWKVTVSGTTLSCVVTDPASGNTLASTSVSDSAFAEGLAGFRIKKDDGGTFRNLKVTVTAKAEKQEEPTVTAVETLEHTLTTNTNLPTITTYGATTSVTADGLKITSTGNAGFPYVLFGQSYWKDYTVDVDTHGVHTGGVIVRGGNGAINNPDGFGGYVCSYDSSWLFTGTGTVGKDGKAAWAQIKTGSPYASALSYAENLHWHIVVKGTQISCTVTDPATGNTLAATTVTSDAFAEGMVGLRIKKDDGGTFRNLKISVQSIGKKPTPPKVVINHSLTKEAGLPAITPYGCTTSVTPDGLKITATGSAGFPYVLFGQAGWKDYTVEVDTHNVHVGGIIVRGGNGAVDNPNGFGGYACSYDSSWLFGGTGTVGGDGKATWAQIKTGDPYASALSFTSDLHWVVEVKDNTIKCTVTDLATGKQVSAISLTDSAFDAGMVGFRIKKDDGGTFRNLKVTLVGERNPGTGDNTLLLAGGMAVVLVSLCVLLVSDKRRRAIRK